jgi:hypothetical protein
VRARDFITDAKKKIPAEPKAGDTTTHDFNPGWEELNYLKSRAATNGNRMAGSLQLFVPRPTSASKTRSERYKELIQNPYAWDDEGNLKPNYATWVDQSPINEAAPILKPGKAITPPGNNKPIADLWTSTAIKNSDGTYTSDWAKWVANNQQNWSSKTGYLYRVKPGALILELNYDSDAERIFDAFRNLERVPSSNDISSRYDQEMEMRKHFPWDQVAKHFDAIHHWGYRGYGDSFVYGWDVESIAWLDTSFLQLVGEVPVRNYRDEES